RHTRWPRDWSSDVCSSDLLSSLRWPEDTVARLARMGVRTIGAALRLPRAGFVRRFGDAQLAMLDVLTGRTAEVRVTYRAPERFRSEERRVGKECGARQARG